tara:strand:- start:433 stop:2775 length:2343 start_codon:yes stop_codon:yes gene_type:complete
MVKRIFILIFYLFPVIQYAQDFSALWEGHFSFQNITEVVKGTDKIYAAAQNAVFSYDTQTGEFGEITTINGLSGNDISTIYYSMAYELLIIGYQNGLIEIVFDDDENTLSVVDILEKVTIAGANKRINHFNVYENSVYISTNYGISVFDLEQLEFGDTFFIGNGGTQIPVKQTAIFNGFIYAACLQGNGLRKASLSNPNLIDFQNWQTITTGDFAAVEVNEDKLYALRTNRRIYEVVNDALNERFLYANLPVEIKSEDGNLMVTTNNNVFVYGSNFNLISQVSVDTGFNTRFNSVSIVDGNIYIGTKDFGVLKTFVNNTVLFEEVRPEGPLLNTPFSIQAETGGLWVTYGEYSSFYNPYPLNSRGFSHLKGNEWINTPYSEVFDAKSLNGISINPFNSEQVFISSFFSGILEVNNDVPTILYNETNSGLDYITYGAGVIDIRAGATAFDESGLLWTITSLTENPLKSFNPVSGQWVTYDLTNVIAKPDDNVGFHEVIIDPSSGTKFIASFSKGVIGFNENNGNQLLKNISDDDANLPIKSVRALALDNRNQLWIGTHRGLRVLYNTSGFFTDDNITTEEIIILEDGIAKELLADQFVSDIKVDGSNNKWIATIGSGIFYLSSDGQKTIFHFTTNNSPLPSNNVNDISIDNSNGVVYMATDRGLVSFRSGGSSALEDLQSAYAYPNPVRPGFDIVEQKVKIKDISENVNIKITDIEGNLVAEAQSRTNQRYSGYNLEIDGGTAFWNGKNLANNIVASGVYLVMLSDLDTFETRVLKLMVVR